jgi:8-oxo-dGTP pyrophosphatase MutT (NUDIX family)
MDFQWLIFALSKKLSEPLPGETAQIKMASHHRLHEMSRDLHRETAIKSSVLILLYPGEQEKEVFAVLIQRPSYEGVHGGQISLPGGKTEKHDRDLQATAIRETREEIGIGEHEITIIGRLSELYIPPSNFIVFPFVGFTARKPLFHPDPQEVDEIIEIRISDLIDDNNIKNFEIKLRSGLQINAPCFFLEGNNIWGATAMILSEFKDILNNLIRNRPG